MKLTVEKIKEIEDAFSNEFGLEAKHSVEFARAIEEEVLSAAPPSNISSGESDERAAFEAWAKAYGRIFLDRPASGLYAYAFTQEAWVGWKARAALASPAQAPAAPSVGEPVAWAATDETCSKVEALSFNESRRFDTPLYFATPPAAPAATEAPSEPKRKKSERSAVDIAAEKAYTHMTDNHPVIHSNRFPTWRELPTEQKREWRVKVKAGGAQ